jgi:putative ABC transport system substrate-binding protein
MTGRRAFLGGAAALLAARVVAEAQPVAKAAKIGILQPGPRPPAWVEAFRQGLREHGYVEGQNIIIEHRLAREINEQTGLAAELVRLNSAVIFTWSTPAALAVKRATSTIPVVAITGNPVEVGLAASLGRPGGNVTGIAVLEDQLELKRLQLLKEAVPTVSRIAIAWNPDNPAWPPIVKRVQEAAPALRVALNFTSARSIAELDTGLLTAKRDGAEALVVVNEGVFNADPKKVVEVVAKTGLPAIYSQAEFGRFGGLMTYSPHFVEAFRRAASYVDKMLKGAKPSDLPIEQPTRFELVINLKTAKALGLTMPPAVLARADEVIE